MTEKVPILVVIDGKPHASRFTKHDAAFVARAAELMRFHVIRVPAKNKELHGIAKELPVGKIFATGRAFVPFVSRSSFGKLATLVEGGVVLEAGAAAGPAPVYPAGDMFTSEAINTADGLWSKIEVGTVVLAAQPDVYGPGWWESIVLRMDGDDLTLRWMDESVEESFHASRRDVALRHPATDQPKPTRAITPPQ